MRRIVVAVVLLVVPVFASSSSSSSSYVVPTTTLAVQTANNTSAANSFATQSNNNRGAGNVSKVDIHTLLYPGSTTKVYAHLMLWFGGSNHMNVGYSSTNATQVKNQLDDMVSRGIDGVILDWYGPNNAIDQAARLVMTQAETHPGFTFAIMIDQGAIQWYPCGGCSPQQTLINDLQYLESTYFPSPAYMKVNGQPLVTNFNIDLSYSVDWTAANAALSTHPAFVFQNNNGFTHTLSDGSYSWVMPTTTDYGMSYLGNFYSTALGYGNEQTVGAGYKGFNDTLASWGSNRIMSQQCGQTWLQTFSKINSLYNSGNQLPAVQLVTWNDYEEATELESGIDNCLSVSAHTSSNTLDWSVNGNENTVDHYTVYISSDGQNLMALTDVAAGTHSLDLCSFSVPDGDYQMLVQAVGKPSLANQMSGTVAYTASCNPIVQTPPPPPPQPTPGSVSLAVTPGSVTIMAGQAAILTLTATPTGNYSSLISLSCGSLPSNLSCSFSPTTLSAVDGPAVSKITISAAPVVAGTNGPEDRHSIPIRLGWIVPFGLAGFAFMGNGRNRRYLQALVLCGLVGLGVGATSCGNAPRTSALASVSSHPVSYSITLNGESVAGKLSTSINVIVQ